MCEIREWGIKDDPYLRCGHESIMMALVFALCVSLIVSVLSVAKLRDARVENSRLVSVIEGLTNKIP
jgi:hypothetical protein